MQLFDHKGPIEKHVVPLKICRLKQPLQTLELQYNPIFAIVYSKSVMHTPHLRVGQRERILDWCQPCKWTTVPFHWLDSPPLVEKVYVTWIKDDILTQVIDTWT